MSCGDPPPQLHGKRSFTLHIGATLRTTLEASFGASFGAALDAAFLKTFRHAIEPGGVNLLLRRLRFER